MKMLFTLVGMQYRGAKEIVARMRGGELLELRRDPNNRADFNAVEVWHDGKHIAFIKGTEVPELARYMDAKAMPKAYGKFAVGADRWPQAELDL